MKLIYNFLAVLIVPSVLILYSFSNGSPGGKTGSTGDDGVNCASCHTDEDPLFTDWILTDIPEEGYTPGETYTITLFGTHTGVNRFGFELTAENSAGVKKGIFEITDTERTKITSLGNSVTHTFEGTTPTDDIGTWSMLWTAPASGTGSVDFNAAFNAANGDNNTTGDHIYLSMLTVEENLSTSVNEDYLADQISIYPNPATNMVNLSLPDGAELHLVNIMGQVLLSRELTSSKESLDISDFNNGIYFVQVIHNGETHTSRLLKN